MDGASGYDRFEIFTPALPVAEFVHVERPARLFLEIAETDEGGLVFAETDPVSGYTLACGVLS